MAVRVSVASYVPAITVVGTFSARAASRCVVPVPAPAAAVARVRDTWRPAAVATAGLAASGAVWGRTTGPATTEPEELSMTFGVQPRLTPAIGVVVGPV